MDNKTFEQRIAQLEGGSMVNDPSVFHYACTAMYEYKRLFDALRKCCDKQAKQVELLKNMNKAYERSLRNYMVRVRDLEETVKRLECLSAPSGGDPFDLL